MNENTLYDLGLCVGRKQAFGLIAGACTAADAQSLVELKEQKLYLQTGLSWDEFCEKRLGISRSFADQIIRHYKQFGPNFYRLRAFAPITPAHYRAIAGVVSDDGLAFEGSTIPFEEDRAADLRQAVDTLKRDLTPEPAPPTPVEALAKAAKSLKSILAEFERIQNLNLDENGRLELVVAVEAGRDHPDRIRMSTDL